MLGSVLPTSYNDQFSLLKVPQSLKKTIPKKAFKPKPISDKALMEKICRAGRSNGRITKLCGNWALFKELKGISKSRKVPFELAVGISLRESHIGTNFKSTKDGVDDSICEQSNNWSGLKKRVLDNGVGTKTVTLTD